MTIRPMETRTFRDSVEAKLLELFPRALHDLSPKQIDTINQHKDGTFGFSYLGLMLYTNGHNKFSKSTHHSRGLLYSDDDATFGVGVFFKKEAPSKPNIHIVAPRGKDWVKAVNTFVDQVKNKVPEVTFYVRQLSLEQERELGTLPNLERIQINLEQQHDSGTAARLDLIQDKLEQGRQVGSLDDFRLTYYKNFILPSNGQMARWTSIELKPWIPKAQQEDETFNHSRVTLGETLSSPEGGMFKTIPGLSPNSSNMRRRNYKGFENFLERNKLSFELVPYSEEMQEQVRNLVRCHFEKLDEKGKGIGSTAADYENLISADPNELQNADTHFYVGVLKNKQGDEVPIAFYALEKIGDKTVAGYATITNYDSEAVKPIMNCFDKAAFIGFGNVKAYVEGWVMHRMQELGYEYMELGGSETKDLDDGKERFGAKLKETRWVVDYTHPNNNSKINRAAISG